MLILHLPLNGNFNNTGLINNWVFQEQNTGTHSIYESNGMMTKQSLKLRRGCLVAPDYSFMQKYINHHSFSYCVWIKTSDANAKICWLSYGLGLQLQSGKLSYYFYNTSGMVRGNGITNLNDNNWHHVGLTYSRDTNYITLYVDGKPEYCEKYSKNTTYCSSWTNGLFIGKDCNNSIQENYYNGNLNDFRFYDEELSAVQMSRLSKALILNYNFNIPQIMATRNLGNSSTTYDGIQLDTPLTAHGWGGDAGTVIYHASGGYNNYPYVEYRKTANGSGGIYYETTNDINIIAGKTYTMSVYIKSNHVFNDSPYSFNINRGKDNYYIIGNGQIFFSNEWKRIFYTFTATEAQAGLYSHMSIVYNDKFDDLVVYYSGFQIEEGSAATPFTCKIRNENYIPDCSGENHFSTGNNIIIKQDDTARHQSFVDLTVPSSYIHLTKPGELSFVTHGTITFWARYKSSSGYLMCLADESSTSRYFAAETGGGWYHGNAGASIMAYCDGKANNRPNKDGKWHFYAFTGVDLSKFTGISNISAYGGSTGNGFQFHGELAEYNIYNTILSVDEIQHLYKCGGKITNNYKMVTNELVEKSSNLALKTQINMTNPDNIFSSITKHSTYTSFIPQSPHGITAYNYQKYAKVAFTKNGIHIFSPPNIVYSAAGNTMYGGVGFEPLDIDKDALQKDHLYLITWDMEGQSSRACDISWTNNYGWGGGGLSPQPLVVDASYPSSNFRGKMHCHYKFKINDNIWKICTTPYSSFEKGESYISYSTFVINYSYADTGAYGTDIYINNFQLFDITDGRVVTTQIVPTASLQSLTFNEMHGNNLDIPLGNIQIKTLEDNSVWARIFWHNNNSGQQLFASEKEAGSCYDKYKISFLNLLYSWEFKTDNGYEFLLEYPCDSSTQYNRWIQKSNPCSSTTVEGYAPIHIDWTGNWEGLVKNTNGYAYIDGSSASTWYYTIGAYRTYGVGIPSYNSESTNSITQLWLRIDQTPFYNRFKKLSQIYKEEVASSEFIEE